MSAFSQSPLGQRKSSKSPLLSELEELLVEAKNLEILFITDTEYRLESRIRELEAQVAGGETRIQTLCNKMEAQAQVIQGGRDEIATLLAEQAAAEAKSAELVSFLRASLEQSRITAARVPDLEKALVENKASLNRLEEFARIEQSRAEKTKAERERALTEFAQAQSMNANLRKASEKIYENLAQANARVAWFEETVAEPGPHEAARGEGEAASVKIRYLERRLAEAEKKIRTLETAAPDGA